MADIYPHQEYYHPDSTSGGPHQMQIYPRNDNYDRPSSPNKGFQSETFAETAQGVIPSSTSSVQ